MIDPGRILAEAIYFLQVTIAQILWAVNRAALSIAVITESINSWITENIGYFVQLLVNALSAPLGGMFILALTALGLWYLLNNIVSTDRWVDPSKLLTYGFLAFLFFSSPIVVVDMLEDLRQALNAGIDAALIDGAVGDIFDTDMDGTDPGLPGAIGDINSDGVVGSFDLVAAYLLVGNIDELDNSEFPVDFEAMYFPFGDPSGIDLSDEADQELAKALGSDGIERLFFSLFAAPTAIAEHFLRLALTGVAVFIYTGVPFAMLFAFFIYTQAFLGAYLKQFINLLIETLMSVIITAVMIGLLTAAARQGIGLYIGASVLTFIVLMWRIKSALKLAASAVDLFGGATITGGSGGMDGVRAGAKALTGTAVLAGAALTGGATIAAGSAALAGAAALQADGREDGRYLGMDPAKTTGRVRQLKTMAGYAIGRSPTARSVIEGVHEVRTLGRNFRDGDVQPHAPDMLDYMRAGSAMSGFGSSPWLAMRVSPSLRAAYDEIGGRRNGSFGRDAVYDGDGELVDLPPTSSRSSRRNGHSDDTWRAQPATERQLAYLQRLGVLNGDDLTRGDAHDLISSHRDGSVGSARSGKREGRGSGAAAEAGLAQRFDRLEHALAALTVALTSAGNGAAAVAAGAREGEPVNGPLPAWLRDVTVSQREESGAAGSGGGTVSQTEAVPTVELPIGADDDLFRDDNAGDPTVTDDGAAGTGTIRLQPADPARRQVIHDTVAQLADETSLSGQAARKTLSVYTGEANGNRIQEAVEQHTAATVQEAADAVTDLVAQYRERGLADAEILAAFQSGEGATAIREQGETPLSDAQLSAVADMMLLPQRRLTRTELVTIIGREAAAGAADAGSIARAIGMGPEVVASGFGSQTGNVRGVLEGARSMQLSPADLARLETLLQEGLRDAAQAELADRGLRPDQVRDLISDMSALPGVLVVPQSTASSPADSPNDTAQDRTKGNES